ncbi:MAG: glycoside hydrolase family 31 protein [Bacteroidales bacterium]|nr:glycoside hydrolase family 31 protein [Bacteroidales bacterium]
MKKANFLMIMVFLPALLPLIANCQEFTMAGNYVKYTKTKNIVDFNCTNAKIRVDICSDDILRIRMRQDGEFKPDETYVVIRYDWPVTSYTIKDQGDYIVIETKRMQIKAFKSPFHFEFLDPDGKPVNKDWKEGSMGFRGNEIICKKELSGTDHFFGLGQRYEKSDLRGMKATCLVTREYTPVPFFLGTDGYGIFFHNTWTSTFDFTQNPYTFSAPGGGELDYYFIYGPGFKQIIQQYSKITGLSPLPPKWAFGLFFSRWNEEVEGIKYRQDGQQGMLRTIKTVREVWDWPLDGIRVHSMGPKQSFYASPSLNWPDMLWGEFPSVDSFVVKLHEQHIHPLFWEAPGITGNCKMYDEAVKNNFLLTKDGKPQNIVFGYLQPPGGMVDFMNPEARKWWGRYHYYMADFGSDGVAGDWNDEKMLRGTASPYNGMGSDEFLNIYSLLFNQASWEAYRERKPDKRCINFGLVYWAGGQRYPMQGTQDSHAAGKNIWGEMMGCINLGMSGIPFRTFTDNVSRELTPGLPYSRLSQYLSLTVAGERTLSTQTGIEMADWNYRHYGKLRYRLMPYIYTYAREATINGTPLVRALVLENQNDTKTYDSFCEYLLGKEILIAPLWSDTTFYRDIYLPEGEWIDLSDDITYTGKQTINFHAPIDKVPIFVKAGSIIPMAPDNQHYIDEIKSPLTIQIYPKGRSSFELYEDDGESYDYEKGIFSTIAFSSEEITNGLIIKKEAPAGKYVIPEKEFVICVHKKPGAKDVMCLGSELPHCRSVEEFNVLKAGWLQEDDGKKLLWIKVDSKAADKFEVKVSY